MDKRDDPDFVRGKIEELGPWFHNMELCGVQAAPGHSLGDYPMNKWKRFEGSIPGDLSGMTVLDIGCNAGFYSIEMKKRGARRVVAVDYDEYYLKQARFAAGVRGVDIEFMNLSVYEIPRLGESFDIVMFMGVFYHLRHPLLALDLIHDYAAKDILVFQSMLRGSAAVERTADDYPFSEREVFERPGFPRMHFIEKSYSGDGTNWWLPNRACVEAMLRSSGFEITGNPEEEVYICRRRRG